MIDSYLRTSYQRWLVDPLLPTLLRTSFSPHAYTFGALILGLAVLPSLYYGYTFLSCFFLILSGYFDTLDGSIARAIKNSSPIGAVIDIVSDRTVECAVIIGLFLVEPESRGIFCLLMMSSAFLCVTSFLVVGIFTENTGNKGFHYSVGIMERSEAFLLFGLMILLPSYFNILAAIFSFLVTLTCLTRVWQFSQNNLCR